MSHNYFTSLSISPNRKWLIISILILILYEHLISFTQSLRFLCNYASLRNAELVRKEEALYLRFFTQELEMRKFAISCCDIYRHWFYYPHTQTIMRVWMRLTDWRQRANNITDDLQNAEKNCQLATVKHWPMTELSIFVFRKKSFIA